MKLIGGERERSCPACGEIGVRTPRLLSRWRLGISCTRCGARFQLVVEGALCHVVALLSSLVTSILFPIAFIALVLGSAMWAAAAVIVTLAIIIGEMMLFASRATLQRVDQNERVSIVRMFQRWLTR